MINLKPYAALLYYMNFEVVSAVITAAAVLSTANKYVNTTFQMSKESPRILALGFLCFAWLFTINFFILQYTYLPTNTLDTVMRASFGFSAITMLFGPFLILCPVNPIPIKKETFFKRLVQGAQKKETRYFSLFLFSIISLLQIVVVWSLWRVLITILQVEIRISIAMIVGYCLLSIFYLVIFYSIMTKKPVVINGIDLLDEIRRNIDVLGSRAYTKVYVFFFVVACAIALGFTLDIYLNQDMNRFGSIESDGVSFIKAYFAVDLITIVVMAVFCLNVAFNPISVTKDVQVTNSNGVTQSIPVRHLLHILVSRLNDRVVLSTASDTKAENKTKCSRAAEDCFRYSQFDAPVEPHYKGNDTHRHWGEIHQLNDEKCMFLLGTTGVSVYKNRTLYEPLFEEFLYSLSEHVREHLVDKFLRGFDLWPPESWNVYLSPYLSSSFEEYNDANKANMYSRKGTARRVKMQKEREEAERKKKQDEDAQEEEEKAKRRTAETAIAGKKSLFASISSSIAPPAEMDMFGYVGGPPHPPPPASAPPPPSVQVKRLRMMDMEKEEEPQYLKASGFMDDFEEARAPKAVAMATMELKEASSLSQERYRSIGSSSGSRGGRGGIRASSAARSASPVSSSSYDDDSYTSLGGGGSGDGILRQNLSAAGLMDSYSSSSSSSSRNLSSRSLGAPQAKLEKVRAEVDAVKDVMSKNIDMILERGDRLDSLMDKADDLSANAAMFTKKASAYKKKGGLQGGKRVFFCICCIVCIIIPLIIFFVTVGACGGFDFPKCK